MREGEESLVTKQHSTYMGVSGNVGTASPEQSVTYSQNGRMV